MRGKSRRIIPLGQKVIGYRFGDSVKWLEAKDGDDITSQQVGTVVGPRDNDICADEGLLHVQLANGRWSPPLAELQRVSADMDCNFS